MKCRHATGAYGSNECQSEARLLASGLVKVYYCQNAHTTFLCPCGGFLKRSLKDNSLKCLVCDKVV